MQALILYTKVIYNFFFVKPTCQKLWPRLKFLLTDGRTDRRTDGQGDYYRAPHFQCGGPKNTVNQINIEEIGLSN